jgi:signal transduction histidine kinase/CRP-like cAMP-binding protein
VPELTGLLQSLPIFAGIPRAGLTLIAGQLRRRRIPKGAAIFKQGDPAREFCLLTSGRLEVTVAGGDPDSPPVGIIEAPSWFGELAVITRKPRTATITALTDSEVWLLPRSDFDGIFDRQPELARNLISTLCERIQRKDQDFLGQSTLAIERARLLKDLRERNEELAALGEVTRAVSASLDLDETLGTISTHAAQLTGSDSASIYLYDEIKDAFEIRASYNTPEEYVREAEQQRILETGVAAEAPLPTRSPIARAVVTRSPIQIPEVEATTAYESRDLLLRWGYRALLAVPLLHGERVIGVMNVRRKRAGEFSTREVELVTTFARQSAVAIENARLFQNTQSQRIELEKLSKNLDQLYRLSTAMQEPLSLRDQLARVLEAARQVVAIDRVYIWAVTPDGDRLVNLAGAGFSEEESKDFEGANIPLTEAGAMHRAYQEGVPLVIDEQHPLPPELRLRPPYSNLKPVRTRSFVVIPMIARGRTVGLLTADNKVSRQPIPPHTVQLLRTFASHAAVAVENARLFHEIDDKSHQLEIASKHKSQFLASMSHELRTPLNAIIGFSEVLLDPSLGSLPGEEQHEFLTNILTSGKHLLRLINDVLDLSKIEAGKMELHPEAVSLVETVEGVLGTVKPLASKKQIHVQSLLAADLPPAWADAPRLKQILYNLLSNAIKFTPASGHVTVTVRRVDLPPRQTVDSPGPSGQVATRPVDGAGGWLEVSVSDTGIGIPAEDLERIFEEFEQVSDPARPRQEGTGLGLALVRKLVEMHGGRIRVASTPGQGSTFTFVVPAATVAPPSPPPETAPGGGRRRG